MDLLALFEGMRWQDLIDILVITVVIYKLLTLLKGTRAFQLAKGFFLVVVLTAVAKGLNLDTFSWLLGRTLSLLLLALPIVFQPELRKLLEEIGRGSMWRRRKAMARAETLADEMLKALTYLKVHRVGALVVLQRGTGLKDFWSTAVPLNADITQELLISLFWKNNPLHDGAVILTPEKMIAGGCYLPLTEEADLSRWLGTRHRAAIGVTEVSDAVSLVVSEERGEISMAISGKLIRDVKESRLKAFLLEYFSGQSAQEQGWMESLHQEIRQLSGGTE